MARTPRCQRSATSDGVRVVSLVKRDARQEAVIETIRRVGLSARSAALSCGVPASSFYEWVDSDPSFRERIAEAERQFERAMASVIVTAAAKTRSWRAAVAYLERRFPSEWGERARLDLHVDDERAALDALTDAELQERLRAGAAETLSRMDPVERSEFLARFAREPVR